MLMLWLCGEDDEAAQLAGDSCIPGVMQRGVACAECGACGVRCHSVCMCVCCSRVVN